MDIGLSSSEEEEKRRETREKQRKEESPAFRSCLTEVFKKKKRIANSKAAALGKRDVTIILKIVKRSSLGKLLRPVLRLLRKLLSRLLRHLLRVLRSLLRNLLRTLLRKLLRLLRDVVVVACLLLRVRDFAP